MIILLTRRECSLCEQAELLFQQTIAQYELQSRLPAERQHLHHLDISCSSRLERRYGWSIPVLYRWENQAKNHLTPKESDDTTEVLDTIIFENHLESVLTNYANDVSKTVLDRFSCITQDGQKLGEELYWPFPPSKCRDFLLAE